MLFHVISAFILALIAFFPEAAEARDRQYSSMAFTAAERHHWEDAHAHARRASDDTLERLITWMYLLDADSGAGFEETARFIADNPGWPEQKRLRVRAEMALRGGGASDEAILQWFDGNPPVTGVGKMALAEALKRNGGGDNDAVTTLIREAWRDGDFDEAEEKRLMSSYSRLLRAEDHIARIDRLLWESKIVPARRILNLAPGGHEKLFKARIALIEHKRTAGITLALVPSSLKKDPGLIYDRMRYKAYRNDDSGVRDMLLMAPASVPYPEKWWRARELQVREAIDEGKYSLAKKLMSNHGQVDGSELADAIWLQGWLMSEFGGNTAQAVRLFEEMYDKVRYPVSRARASYWAGRASEKSGTQEAAMEWYRKAARYQTTFYGQLASHKVSGHAPLRLVSVALAALDQPQRRGDIDEVMRAARICIEEDEMELASKLLGWLAENAASEEEARSIAALAGNEKFLGVRAAKKAQQQGFVLVESGYPMPDTPGNAVLERPLTLAITRQESEFDPRARSTSNARGLMQLLPSTGKEVARKHGLRFSSDRLYEEDYNLLLGTLYLDRLINGYDGSYVMAIAAYNAGPGNVRKWIKQFGTPGGDPDEAVNWIERIPFSETRNYVQRVLENLQVYRNLESGGDAPLRLEEDLVR